jgi:Fe-S-cluster containining protein
MSEIINNRYGSFEVSGRCSGSCCNFFYIQRYTLEEINSEKLDHMHDIAAIREMLIPLTLEEIQSLNKTDSRANPNDVDKIFTCKYHDKETGNCRIYKTRPSMCRAYPFYNHEGACEHAGCTYKVRKLMTEQIESQLETINNNKKEH